MVFRDILDGLSWQEIQESIQHKTGNDVEAALYSQKRTLEDFKALISPAATPFLEQMAQQSRVLTQKRFGRTIQLFAPLYLSNECTNHCVYCGFSKKNDFVRKTLNENEILQEALAVKKLGFDHILLVTGEAPGKVDAGYIKKAVEIIKPHFSNVSIEVQPLEQCEYELLEQSGVYAVLVYQETYQKTKYAQYHPKGKKADFYYRLGTPERVGQAGMHKIGLGVLLGLEDWRTDSFFCAAHLQFLMKKFWRSKFSVSFPRIRPAEGMYVPDKVVTDKELVQLICAFRLFNEDLELSISTRESENFRNNIIRIGATTLSAGAKTNPGGYALNDNTLKQFSVCDGRTPDQVAQTIASMQYEVVWKDWDRAFV